MVWKNIKNPVLILSLQSAVVRRWIQQKAIGIIINNPEFADVGEVWKVWLRPRILVYRSFAVPTTTGTAAEVTINYVITDVEKKRKFVCVDTHDIPVVAVVDPDMMSSMPKGLTAATGMDALTHTIEGYITKAAWEIHRYAASESNRDYLFLSSWSC